MRSRYFLILIFAFISINVSALSVDSLRTVSEPVAVADSVSQPKNLNFVQKVIKYFADANKAERHEGMDFSLIAGPHYSSDVGLGLAIIAAGQYYACPLTDTVTNMSNMSLKFDITTKGFYDVGMSGNHYSANNLWRIDYDVDFEWSRLHYWGVGYDRGVNEDNYTKFDQLFVGGDAYFYRRLGRDIYAGPMMKAGYTKAYDVTDPTFWDGQDQHIFNLAVGLSFIYDTRDNLTDTKRGVLVGVHQRFSPRFLGNKYAFSSTEVLFSGFQRAWKGAVIAGNFRGIFNYGNVSWANMATFGGSDNMRGYYEGRFRDKCSMDATIELRQYVWRRCGFVVWAGAGTVFDTPSDLRWNRVLPNGGVGLRWQFKKNTNLRLDFGVGRGEKSIIFNINEAF